MFLKQTIDHRTSYYLDGKVLDCKEFGLMFLIADRHMKIMTKELENLMLRKHLNNDATQK